MFDRSQEDIILGMQLWLNTKSLSTIERGLIEDLRNAAVESKEKFLELYIKYMNSFASHFASAAIKAEDEGIARKFRV